MDRAGGLASERRPTDVTGEKRRLRQDTFASFTGSLIVWKKQTLAAPAAAAATTMAAKEKMDLVHQNIIQAETVRKELRHQKLNTEFSINPHRKLHILPDKPMARKPTEVIVENSDFIEAFHKARQEPTKKHARPLTESQQVGWLSAPLIPRSRGDSRLDFSRRCSDVTKHQESALRSSC